MTRPAYVQMAVRVPRDLKARMEQLAAEQSKHVSELVRELLTEGLMHRAATKLDQGSSE